MADDSNAQGAKTRENDNVPTHTDPPRAAVPVGPRGTGGETGTERQGSK